MISNLQTYPLTYPRQLSPYEQILLEQAQAQPQQTGGSLPLDLFASAGAPAGLGSSVPAIADAGGASGSYTLPTTLGVNGPTSASTAANLGAVLPWLGVAGIGAGTAYSAYKGYQGAKNKGIGGGFKAGVRAAGPLNFVPMLGQAAWAAGALRGAFGGKKHKDQYLRDSVRQRLKGSLLDDAYNITLADGNKFDVGKDGSVKNYNVDMSRAGAADAISQANALAYIISGGNKKVFNDFAGYGANAAMSSGDVGANLRKMYGDSGLNHDTAYMQIHNDKTLDTGTKDAMKNALDQLYGVGAYAGGATKPVARPAVNPRIQGRPIQPLSQTQPKPAQPYMLTNMRR